LRQRSNPWDFLLEGVLFLYPVRNYMEDEEI